MRKLFFILTFIEGLSCIAQIEAYDEIYLRDVIGALSHDSMKGRAPGTEEELLSAAFIQCELAAINNCETTTQRFKFTHHGKQIKSRNIIGFIDNNVDSTIMIMAHYDHLGMSNIKSKSGGTSVLVHNGADDNASGVALMLLLGRTLNTSKYNYLLVAVSGHELGLYGSKYFQAHIKRKFKSIKLLINFDMVGRLNVNRDFYFECTDKLLKTIENQNPTNLNFIQSTKNRLTQLDTKWFLNSGIEVATYTTGSHIDYHKVTDDEKFINYKGLLQIKLVLEHWIFNL